MEVNIVLLLGCIYWIALAVLYKVPRGHTSHKIKDIVLKYYYVFKSEPPTSKELYL